MMAIKTQSTLLVLALFGALIFTPGGSAAAASAQTATGQEPGMVQGKGVKPERHAIPFIPGDETDVPPQPIEFLNVDQMTPQDRMQAANAESSIGEHAGFAGLEFNEGNWIYQQVVCPALPGHIFLRFSRDNGTGDVSMFTASIPRDGEGQVRIIPLRYRGYSLFSPAPINGMTIAAFNRIRTEENPEGKPVTGWLGTALCYAALAGGRPKLGHPSESPEKVKFPLANSGMLELPSDGGAVISFPDVGVDARPVQWSMTVNTKGKLVKASRTPAPLVQGYWYIHPRHGDETGTIVPGGRQPVLKSRPVPPGPVALSENPQAPHSTSMTPTPAPPHPNQPSD
jgi:hypothetical protein